jgi:alpha-amylase
MPGSPFIYYGEEIGMFGSGVDPNLRTGMLWSVTDASGIPNNPPGSGDVRLPEFGVAEQLDDPDSLLNYYRAILALKAEHQDIFDSIAEKVEVESRYIAAIRTGNVIVMHNLSDESVSIHNDSFMYSISGYVSPTGESPTANELFLTLPPYSSVVLG